MNLEFKKYAEDNGFIYKERDYAEFGPSVKLTTPLPVAFGALLTGFKEYTYDEFTSLVDNVKEALELKLEEED